ncbi:uncharacterized protein CBL_07820 [Carabus blaptoides fortunei]
MPVSQLLSAEISHCCNYIGQCAELCELRCREPTQYVSIDGDPCTKLQVRVQDSFADHPLVIGPRYQPSDVRCTWASFLGRQTSGVLVFGVNDGVKTAQRIHQSKPTRSYRISGQFGQATDTFFKDGRIVEKSTFRHVKRVNIDRCVAAMQATHQKQMFELCGVDIQSQAAYELATSGLIRPSNSKTPLLYGIRCVHFESPNFTIEVQCINEYEQYLRALIHEIGVQMHTTAHCTAVQCIRHSHFTLHHALLQKHWTLQHLLDNMSTCRAVLAEHEHLVRHQSAVLI